MSWKVSFPRPSGKSSAAARLPNRTTAARKITTRITLCPELINQIPTRTRRTLRAAVPHIGGLQMIQTQQVQNRRVDVENVMRLVHRAQTDLVGAADRLAALHAAARHPHRETPRVVIAPVLFARHVARDLS